MQKKLSAGIVHELPEDLRKAISANTTAITQWETLTPLARNEWICWVTFFKKEETRKEHITRLVKQLKEGKRRPCCWPGCIHRNDKKVSPSVKAILERRTKKPL